MIIPHPESLVKRFQEIFLYFLKFQYTDCSTRDACLSPKAAGTGRIEERTPFGEACSTCAYRGVVGGFLLGSGVALSDRTSPPNRPDGADGGASSRLKAFACRFVV